MSRLAVLILIAVVAVLLSSCGEQRVGGPYTADENAEAVRDIQRASELYAVAIEVITEDPEAAKALLHQCLEADLYHGPAHNNLGVLYLQEGRLYDAAMEFTWARKLLPGHPDPRVNLAIALDRGGKTQEALAAANAALETQENYLPALKAMAMIQIRERLHDENTRAYLEEIRYRGEEEWRDWAETWLHKLPKRG